jgi:hypothetical protein
VRADLDTLVIALYCAACALFPSERTPRRGRPSFHSLSAWCLRRVAKRMRQLAQLEVSTDAHLGSNQLGRYDLLGPYRTWAKDDGGGRTWGAFVGRRLRLEPDTDLTPHARDTDCRFRRGILTLCTRLSSLRCSAGASRRISIDFRSSS